MGFHGPCALFRLWDTNIEDMVLALVQYDARDIIVTVYHEVRCRDRSRVLSEHKG